MEYVFGLRGVFRGLVTLVDCAGKSRIATGDDPFPHFGIEWIAGVGNGDDVSADVGTDVGGDVAVGRSAETDTGADVGVNGTLEHGAEMSETVGVGNGIVAGTGMAGTHIGASEIGCVRSDGIVGTEGAEAEIVTEVEREEVPQPRAVMIAGGVVPFVTGMGTIVEEGRQEWPISITGSIVTEDMRSREFERTVVSDLTDGSSVTSCSECCGYAEGWAFAEGSSSDNCSVLRSMGNSGGRSASILSAMFINEVILSWTDMGSTSSFSTGR